jgi:hypothetical protein
VIANDRADGVYCCGNQCGFIKITMAERFFIDGQDKSMNSRTTMACTSTAALSSTFYFLSSLTERQTYG